MNYRLIWVLLSELLIRLLLHRCETQIDEAHGEAWHVAGSVVNTRLWLLRLLVDLHGLVDQNVFGPKHLDLFFLCHY